MCDVYFGIKMVYMLCFDFHVKNLGTFVGHMNFEVDRSFFHSTLDQQLLQNLCDRTLNIFLIVCKSLKSFGSILNL